MSAVALLVAAMGLAPQELPYDSEYPAVGYSTTEPTDAVARLQRRIDDGGVELRFDAKSGYLASLLRQLGIPVDSQVLVFSKTSFQVGLISPETPRAIYFKDDVYVAWVQKGPNIEISSVDSNLGAVFYTLNQEKTNRPKFVRQTYLCLRCHDSYSLTGGGVPRHIMGSGIPDQRGRAAYHEGWQITTDESPIEKRWGGWYVTGTHGEQKHLGNLFLEDAAGTRTLDLTAGANVTDLSTLIDTEPYLVSHSDIVALLVMEHQVHVQNQITRLSWEARSAPHGNMESSVESLVRAMLLVGEALLKDPIEGTSGYGARFVRQGPRDRRGRSLRQLDLERRLFRHPCSYLIYSDAFDALPDGAKKSVYRRLRAVLGGEDTSDAFAHLSMHDRSAILEILEETKTDFAATPAK